MGDVATKVVSVTWACPECGATANKHGSGECRSPGSGCSGFVCDCDADVEGFDDPEHGTTLEKPCECAACYHCGWGGTFPVTPKGLAPWEKQALKAGWAPPAKRAAEIAKASASKASRKR
jgi:hypothetical protein